MMVLFVFMFLPLLSVKHRPECALELPVQSAAPRPLCLYSLSVLFFLNYIIFPLFEFYYLRLCVHLLPVKGTRRFAGRRGSRRFIPWPRQGWLCGSMVLGQWGPVPALRQGTSALLLLLFFLLCWGGSCGAFGKGQVTGDGHSDARPALRGQFVGQVLEPQQVQSIWGQLCPLPFQSKPIHTAFTRCQPRVCGCPAGRLGLGAALAGLWGQERDSRGTRTVAAAGGTGFPGCLGKDALSPCPLSQGCPQQLCP